MSTRSVVFVFCKHDKGGYSQFVLYDRDAGAGC